MHCAQFKRGPKIFRKGTKRGPDYEQKGDLKGTKNGDPKLDLFKKPKKCLHVEIFQKLGLDKKKGTWGQKKGDPNPQKGTQVPKLGP